MIKIQNIYYMLAYAFSALDIKYYSKLESEEFNNAAELCTEILIIGLSYQLKRGLKHEYQDVTREEHSPRGKIELSRSLYNFNLKRSAVCSYDVFTSDSTVNRIFKSTLLLLLKSNLAKMQIKKIKRLLMYFEQVTLVKPKKLNWDIRFNSNDRNNHMLVSICWLIINGLLLNQKDGKNYLADIFDEQRMCRLYERFILEYYRKEHPNLKASAKTISWTLDDGYDLMLPIMKTDITLTHDNKTLIIDAKYYKSNIQNYFGKLSLHSNNLYQIFTYIKNEQVHVINTGTPFPVSGMLLYARTSASKQPDNIYHMSGNTVEVRTLDLNKDFTEIKKDLDSIATRYLY